MIQWTITGSASGKVDNYAVAFLDTGAGSKPKQCPDDVGAGGPVLLRGVILRADEALDVILWHAKDLSQIACHKQCI